MATTTDHSEGKTDQASRPVDKYAEARKAKKKAKRMRHRARLKRSHTKG